MSECFIDNGYLTRFGLHPLSNVLQYFLHPANPLLHKLPGGVGSCNQVRFVVVFGGCV